MSDRQIHVNRAGQAYGPYPEGRAREMLAAGQLFATDFAWYEGAAEWKSLSEVLGPTPAAAQPTPPPPLKPAAAGAPKRQLAGAKLEEEKDDPDKIHVTRKGEPIGPYSREKAKEYFIAGTLLSTDWGWHDGMGEGWKPLNEVLELPVKSTKISSENSGRTASIYGIKKKKTSSTKPSEISDKAIKWILFVVVGGCTMCGAIVWSNAAGVEFRSLSPIKKRLITSGAVAVAFILFAFIKYIFGRK